MTCDRRMERRRCEGQDVHHTGTGVNIFAGAVRTTATSQILSSDAQAAMGCRLRISWPPSLLLWAACNAADDDALFAACDFLSAPGDDTVWVTVCARELLMRLVHVVAPGSCAVLRRAIGRRIERRDGCVLVEG